MSKMLTAEEVVRRIRVLRAIPTYERPVRFSQLQKMTGIARYDIHRYARWDQMPEPKRLAKLSAAFLEVESQGKQVCIQRVRITPTGPVLDWVAVNPLAFPELPPVNK